MSTVRQLLGQTPPHLSLKRAWRTTIQALRRARQKGEETVLHSRSAVDSFLATQRADQAEVKALKELLKKVLEATDPGAEERGALMVDRLVRSWGPARQTEPVKGHIQGLPDWLKTGDAQILTGLHGGHGTVSPRKAADLMHHFEGMRLGGSTLSVDVELPQNVVLPPVKRSDRGRRRVRGKKPWLPYFDEVGRYSATPQTIARSNGSILASSGLPVIDPFCGLGADSICAAVAGATVFASDTDSTRLALAAQNAEHFGVSQQITFSCNDANRAVSTFPLRECALFLDPPWGGKDWDRNTMMLDTWLSDWPAVHRSLEEAQVVLLKLPRSFDLETLHKTGRDWTFNIGVESMEDHPADRVRILTAYSVKI